MTSLELPAIIEHFTRFIELGGKEEGDIEREISLRVSKGKDHYVLDFTRLLLFDPELCEQLLEEPSETLKAFEIAIEKKGYHIGTDLVPKKVRVRVKGLPKSEYLPVGAVRSKLVGRFKSITGIVRQKGKVKFRVTMVRFECSSCGTVLQVLQLKDVIQKPKCSCGGKSFRRLSQELIDAYKLLLEEDPENGNLAQLEKIDVLCEADLTDHTVYDRFGPGSKVRITGWINLMSTEKTAIDHFFSANHIEIIGESFEEIKVSEEDKKKIAAFVQQHDDPAGAISDLLYHMIEGYEMEKRGIILQMFGGCTKEVSLSRSRGDFHVLLVGGPGAAKSQLLKITQRAMPKARYTSGHGVTGVGLSAAVVKDELLGGYVLEPGILPLASGGILCLDEIEKAKPEDLQALHEALEEQTISISKANITATLKAETTVLAAANPKEGVFDDSTGIFSQIDLLPTLVNRFDIIFPMRYDLFTDEQQGNIVKKMMSRWNVGCEKPARPPLSNDDLLFVKKYISYAKTFEPMFQEHLNDIIINYFLAARSAAKKANAGSKFPISGRQVDAIRRLSQACARSHLRSEVAEEDVRSACDLLMYSLKQVGINPETGTLDVTYFETGGKSSPKVMKIARLEEFIRVSHLEHPGRIGVPRAEIFERFTEQFGGEMFLDKELERLCNRGNLCCPKVDFYRSTGSI